MRGKQVVKINQWEPTSQTCSCCGHRQSIELRERVFTCEVCGLEIGRDHNAARNIRREAIALLLEGVGASTPGFEGVRQPNAKVSLAWQKIPEWSLFEKKMIVYAKSSSQ